MPERRRMHVLRTGDFTAQSGQRISLSEADLRDIAASYDVERHHAPIVVGHPKSDKPAYGWIRGVDFEDGDLYADPHDVDPQFAEMVRARRFRKISVSLYPPGADNHPTGEGYYLKHVGFLGAVPPVVKGLKEASLGEGDGAETIEIELAEPAESLPTRLRTTGEDSMDDKERRRRDANLAERERKVKARERKLEKAAAKARLQGFEDFAEGLAKDGKILPRHTATIVGLLGALPADAEVEFAETADADPEDTPAVDALQAFLGELPKQIDYAERAGPGKDAKRVKAGAFRLPADSADDPVDQDRLRIHERALALSEKHGITYDAAIDRLVAGGENV